MIEIKELKNYIQFRMKIDLMIAATYAVISILLLLFHDNEILTSMSIAFTVAPLSDWLSLRKDKKEVERLEKELEVEE